MDLNKTSLKGCESPWADLVLWELSKWRLRSCFVVQDLSAAKSGADRRFLCSTQEIVLNIIV
jgi:hypothetical protein